MRNVETEERREATGKKSKALSSRRALFYHDIPPELFKRIARRYTGGHVKYSPEITQNLNWREGLTDPHYVMDRLNHLFEHAVDFLDNGNDNDDNLAAIAWCAGFLMEVERVRPKLLRQIIKQSHRYGKGAEKFKKYLEKKQS